MIEGAQVRYSLTEGWGSEFMTDDHWSYPWDGAKLADYAEAILEAYDAHRAALSAIETDPKRYGPIECAAIAAALLKKVKGLLAEGESMVDVPAMLHLTFDELWQRIHWTSRPPFYVTWDDGDWLFFEAALSTFPQGAYSWSAMGDALGLSADVRQLRREGLRRLGELYGLTHMPRRDFNRLLAA